MIALEIIDALEAAGATPEMILAAIRADQQRLAVRRMLRRARLMFAPESAFLTAPKPDSVPADPPPARTDLLRSNPIKSSARAGALDAPGLTPSEKLVLSRLIEHNNLETGRCDPAVATIVDYTGLTDRSVRRACGRLEQRGLLRRVVNAGRGHRNAFALDLEAIARLMTPLGRKPDSEQNRTLLSGKPDSGVLRNRVRKQSPQAPRARPDPLQPQMLLPIPNRKAVAVSAARSRIHADIAAAAETGDPFNVSGLSPQDWADADLAEVRRPRRGEGLRVVRERLLLATGPPLSAEAG